MSDAPFEIFGVSCFGVWYIVMDLRCHKLAGSVRVFTEVMAVLILHVAYSTVISLEENELWFEHCSIYVSYVGYMLY